MCWSSREREKERWEPIRIFLLSLSLFSLNEIFSPSPPRLSTNSAAVEFSLKLVLLSTFVRSFWCRQSFQIGSPTRCCSIAKATALNRWTTTPPVRLTDCSRRLLHRHLFLAERVKYLLGVQYYTSLFSSSVLNLSSSASEVSEKAKDDEDDDDDEREGGDVPEESDTYKCNDCDKYFSTAHGLEVHVRRTHSSDIKTLFMWFVSEELRPFLVACSAPNHAHARTLFSV